MSEIEAAYANVHLHRAMAILNQNMGYGLNAASVAPPAPLSETAKQDFYRELDRAKAWVDGSSRPSPRVVSINP